MLAITEPQLCPSCKRILQVWDFIEDDYPLFCDQCHESYNAALEKEPVEPKVVEPATPKCYACKKPTEYDPEVRDGWPYWCEHCNLWHNASGEPQPGSYVRVPVQMSAAISSSQPPAQQHVTELEAVAAAALGLYIRSAGELHYIPTERTQNALATALEQLINTGWRPK